MDSETTFDQIFQTGELFRSFTCELNLKRGPGFCCLGVFQVVLGRWAGVVGRDMDQEGGSTRDFQCKGLQI